MGHVYFGKVIYNGRNKQFVADNDCQNRSERERERGREREHYQYNTDNARSHASRNPIRRKISYFEKQSHVSSVMTIKAKYLERQ